MTSKSAQEFVLKTVYKNDVRRVRVDRTRFGWKDLNDLLRKQFKDVSGKRLTYVDEDGDTITMTNQEELDEYFRVAEVSGWKSVKIQVRENSSDDKKDTPRPVQDEDKKKQPVVHWGFTCDVSGMSPITGVRFHKRGEDYDLCEAEFAKLSDEDKKLYERVEIPVRGRWWRRFRQAHQGELGWRHRRHGGRGGKFRGGRHQNVIFRKLKWCFKALKNCDESQLIEVLKSAGGAAQKVVEPLRVMIMSLRDKPTMRVLKNMRRSPTMIKFKEMLTNLQEKIESCQVTIFDAPGLVLNSNEYAVAVAHLRDVLPKLSVAVEKIASLLPALAKEIPSLMPRLLPVFAIMAFGGGGNVATEEKKEEKKEVFRAGFVKDDTLEDGVQVEAGTEVVKTWTIKNTGQSAWPECTALLHVGGDLELRAEEPRVLVGAVKPGQEVSVSVKLTTPKTPGRVWSYWRLVSGSEPSARRFSLKVWADLLVVEKKKPVEKKVVVEKEEEWELPDVPKNSTMIGTTAFDEDSVESKDEIVDDVLKSMETEKEEDLGPWKAAVEMLQEMGFDPKRFRELLKRHNGDIQAIMADMLK